MRRILLTVMASSTLVVAAVPAVATAHGREDARRAQARHRHHHHHRRAKTIEFAPGTVASAPSQSEMPSSAAATVASFEGGVLKLTLADGSTVTGKVTEATEINCPCRNHQGFETDHGGGPGPSGDRHDEDQDNGDPDRGGRDEQPAGASCADTSVLVAGAKIREAQLSVSTAGAVWESIDLLQ